METTGLLKGTGFITKKERDGDEVYESNHAKVTLEIALDELSSEDLNFLARNQNQAIEIEFSPTYRASTRRTRREDPDQLTIDDAARENERIAKIRRVLYFAIEEMPEVAADASIEQLSIALCEHFKNRCGFEVDDVLYAVGTGESGMCPQLFAVTRDGQGRALVVEAAELIEHVRWILNDKTEEQEVTWQEEIISLTQGDFVDNQGNRYLVIPVDPEIEDCTEFNIVQHTQNGQMLMVDLSLVFENVPEHPLSQEEAQIALSAWALKNGYEPIRPQGYGNIYRAENGSCWRVCWLPEEQEGYGYCFRGCSWDGAGEQVWTPIEGLANANSWEQAQTDLDMWMHDESRSGEGDYSVSAYIKFCAVPVEVEAEAVAEAEGVQLAEGIDGVAYVADEPLPEPEEDQAA